MSTQPDQTFRPSPNMPQVDADSYAYMDVAQFIVETRGDRIDVSFDSEGETLAGRLYGSGGSGKPGIVLIGPETDVKKTGARRLCEAHGRSRIRGTYLRPAVPRGKWRGASTVSAHDLAAATSASIPKNRPIHQTPKEISL